MYDRVHCLRIRCTLSSLLSRFVRFSFEIPTTARDNLITGSKYVISSFGMRAVSAVFRRSAVARKIPACFTLVRRNDAGFFFWWPIQGKNFTIFLHSVSRVSYSNWTVAARVKILAGKGQRGKLFTMQESNQISISPWAFLAERDNVGRWNGPRDGTGRSFSNLHGTVSIMKAILKHHVRVTRKKETARRCRTPCYRQYYANLGCV